MPLSGLHRHGLGAALAAIAVTAIGAAVCVAWLANLPGATRLLANSSLVRFNTGLEFVGSGLALLLAMFGRRAIAGVVIAPVLLIAVLTLMQYLTASNLGMDALFVAGRSALHPGEMAGNTVVAFVLAGSSVVLLLAPQPRIWAISMASVLAALVIAIGAIALLGYAMDLTAAFEWAGLHRMAVLTAASFVVLGIGLMLACAEAGRVAAWYEMPWLATSVGIGVAAVLTLAIYAVRAEMASLPERLVEVLLAGGVGFAALLAGTIAQARHMRLQSVRLADANRTLERQSHEIHDLYENAPCGYHLIDPDGVFLRVNRTELDWIGYSAAELVGKRSLFDLLTPSSRAVVLANHPHLQCAGLVRDLELELLRKDGSVLPVLLSTTAVEDATDHHRHCRGTLFDLSNLREAQQLVRRLAAVVEHSEDAILSTTPDGVITSWNRAAERMYGYRAEEVLGSAVELLIPEYERDLELSVRQRIADGGSVASYECRRRRRDGTLLDVSLTVSPIVDGDGKVIGLSKIGRDIGERKRFERALQESEQRLQLVLDTVQTGVIVHRADSSIAYANATASAILGLSTEQLLGRRATEPSWHFVREDGSPMPVDEYPVNRVLAERAALNDYLAGIVTAADAPVRWVLVNAVPQIDADGELRQVIVSFVDISERRRRAQEVEQLALTDTLTGLATRRHLHSVADREFARCRRTGEPLSLIVLDVDHFKAINDHHGHATGDAVLAQLAATLHAGMREIDLAGRWGGEEFCVLLPQTGLAEALDVAERLRRAVASTPTRRPDGELLSITASFGVATLEAGDAGVDAMIERADQAMYRAKRGGRNRVCLPAAASMTSEAGGDVEPPMTAP